MNENATRVEGELSAGTIAGISVGAALFVLLLLGLLVCWRTGLLFFRKLPPSTDPKVLDKAEMHGDAKPWVEAMGKERTELPVKEQCQEAPCQQFLSELEEIHSLYELDGQTRQNLSN